MSINQQFGHTGPAVFWTNGILTIFRHCDKVFELFIDGVSVMPITTFEKINKYIWLEFDVLRKGIAF